jgi:hypothetical protein
MALRQFERPDGHAPAESLTIRYRRTVVTERISGVEPELAKMAGAAFCAAHSSGRSPWLKRFGSD